MCPNAPFQGSENQSLLQIEIELVSRITTQVQKENQSVHTIFFAFDRFSLASLLTGKATGRCGRECIVSAPPSPIFITLRPGLTTVMRSWEVRYNLVIAFKSALMTFSLELDGETIGSVEAHFAH